MPDSSLTAGEIAALVGGTVIGNSEIKIVGIRSLDRAGPGDLSFISSERYRKAFNATRASVVLVPEELSGVAQPEQTRIVVASTSDAVNQILQVLAVQVVPNWGVSPSATLGCGASWKGRLSLGSGSVLGRDVRFGNNCVVGNNVVIGNGIRFGDDCRIGDGVTIGDGVKCGNRVVLHPGARVGGTGFRFAYIEGSGTQRIPHLGACEIGNDVEIGANTTVDRGSVDDTIIGDGTKLDNLVHVAHNVRIGRGCMILAQVGIAGTTTIEDGVSLGGQAGLAGHLSVGEGARVAAQSGVISDVSPHEEVSGYPARSHRAVLRQTAALKRLAPLVATLERIASRENDRK